MSLDSDYLVDRRRMKRKLGFWRVAAIVAAIVAVLGVAASRIDKDSFTHGRAHIARVQVQGVVTGDRETLDMLERLAKSDSAKGVILSIDSPGGTVTGSEAIFDAVRAVAAKRPVVAVVDGMAASGAYIAAMASDRIIARETSLVGSIGVLVQYPNFYELLNHIGVKVEDVKSTPLKASPNPFEPTTPEARAALASIVDVTYDWFKRLVTQRRGIGGADLAVAADGRVFTGQQALPLKLIDEIGSERTAIAWLESEKGLAKDLPIRDWKPEGAAERFGLWTMASELARAAGLSTLAGLLRQTAKSADIASLDGLVAVWHPALQK